MFLIQKKNKPYEVIYKDVLNAYFKYLRNNNLSLSPKGMSEMLRYSLCEVLSLDTIYADIYIKNNSYIFIQQLKRIMNTHNVLNKSKEYRQGLLEACVHCIEMSRKKAGY